MTPRARPHLAAAVAACAAVAALAVPSAAASEGGGAPGAPDTSRPRDAVTLTPAAGDPGSTVTVRARCGGDVDHGGVFSTAFADAPALRPAAAGGGLVAEARVKSGLPPGRSYVVTANCSAAESLTTTFVTSEGRSHRHLARGGSGEEANQVDGVALAFGGGLAGAALAGYLLTARRVASRRRARAGRR
ncbi:hypothetical protein [Streptomyces sp. RKND-216]|uniref:hypothetical protein n=1 Tax=Streptomyces sp. RKND-216 TaxID=2562581 RepID=UPI001448199C|nr:hypothetical protein [Streptomyces sp. RKND-216]